MQEDDSQCMRLQQPYLSKQAKHLRVTIACGSASPPKNPPTYLHALPAMKIVPPIPYFSLKPHPPNFATTTPLSSFPFVQIMAPRGTATAQGESQPTLTKHELPAHKATYVIHQADMEELLKKTFGAGLDFNVSVSQADRQTGHLFFAEWKVG